MMVMAKRYPSTALLLLAMVPIFLSLPMTSSTRLIVSGMNLTLFGAASFQNRSISLTSSSPTDPSTGMALNLLPVRFLDNTTQSTASFYTHFSFSINPSPSFGDGLAFLITSSPPQSLGTCQGCMGLFHESAPESCQAENKTVTIAVEFDTRLDTALHDINDNHVGVDVCNMISVASADAGAARANLRSGIPMKAWIIYSSDMNTIKIWLSDSVFRPLNPLIQTTINFKRILRESMYVGFSASNCRDCFAVHKIFKWKFSTSFPLNYRAVPSDSTPPINESTASIFSSKKPKALWLGLIGALILIFFTTAAIAAVCLWKKKKGCGRKEERLHNQVQAQSHVPKISLDTIKVATNGFHSRNILGQDCFATTYLGVLPSGCKVAVKKFGRVEHFTNALSTILSCSSHTNIIQCQGWCWEKKDTMLLVYEFMANGSLDDNLHATQLSRKTQLPWDKRYQIVLQVAAALCFLHEESIYKFTNRDIRSSNILLDAGCNAKLGDLGLEQRSPMEKTDIYGLGIVLVELATGRRHVDSGVVLVEWVWKRWGNQQLLEAPDWKLCNNFKQDEMIPTLIVGLSCTHPDCKQRPSIKEAIQMLKGTTPLPLLPSRMPAIGPLCSVPQVYEDGL